MVEKIPTVQGNRLAEVASLFLRLGFTSFGGPAAHIAMMRREIVQRRQWVSDEKFIDLMSIVNLIPGPSSTELAIYLGYLRAGWVGLLVAGICFIGPAMLIVLAFAWLYVRFGSLPQAGWLFYGVKPVVIAIIAQAVWGLGRTILKRLPAILVAGGVLILSLLGTNQLILLVGSGLIFVILRWLERPQKNTSLKSLKSVKSILPLFFVRIRDIWIAAPAATTAKVAAMVIPFSMLTLFLTFLKIGAVLYGSGYVLLSFLRTDFVERLGWLTDRQLLDAVSVGQFTPGPVFTTATFVGYLVAGLPGALVATLGIFLPSFIFIAIIHPLVARLRQSPWTAPALDGINAAALALMGSVLFQLGQSALIDVVTWLLALVSLGILLRFKINSAWLIVAGALVGVLRFWLW